MIATHKRKIQFEGPKGKSKVTHILLPNDNIGLIGCPNNRESTNQNVNYSSVTGSPLFTPFIFNLNIRRLYICTVCIAGIISNYQLRIIILEIEELTLH